ncbi:MAG: ABC transporter permease [Chloroflexota bacterium]
MAVLVALVAGLLVGAVVIVSSGTDATEAYGALYEGAFGTPKAVMQTILQATPLLFTGLAAVVAFRGKIWNIGGEGQFLAGAMMTTWVSIKLANLPQPILVPIIILAAMTGGAVWAGIAGYLRAKFRVNEIIVTVMLNYIIEFIMSYILQNHWTDPKSSYPQSISFAPTTYFPSLFDSKLHIGLILVLVMVLLVYLLLWKTPIGYEIRAIGVNPVAAKFKGINVTRTILLTMLVSGALAGLGGGTEIAGVHHRLRLDISAGYGFTGILVAMMGQLNPFGAIVAAVFFGALINGSYLMQIKSQVPVALVHSIQGVILFFLVIAFVVRQYRIRKVQIDE